MTKENILDLMNREIITEVVDPEKLVGKSIEDLKNMGLVTVVGKVDVVETVEPTEPEAGDENDAPVVNDDTNTQKEPEIEDENDAPVVDEDETED